MESILKASCASKWNKRILFLLVLIVQLLIINGQVPGPAGVGNSTGNNDQPIISAWYDISSLGLTDGNKVGIINDKSGNGNDATQTDLALQPVYRTNGINGQPAIDFTTGNHSLNFDGAFLENTPYSLFSVVTRSQNTAYILGGTDNSSNTNLHFGYRNNNTFTLAQWGNDLNTTIPTNLDIPEIFTGTRNNTSIPYGRALFRNGTSLGSNNNTVLLNSYNGAGIATRRGSYYNITLAEQLIYTDFLNDAQRTIVENYLSEKYSISISNDFYSGSTYNVDLIGIGSSDGTYKHSNTSGSGGGMFLKEKNNTLDENDEYIFAAHDGTPATEVTTDLPVLTLPSALTARTSKVWYIDRTEATTTEVMIGFNLSDIALDPGEQNQVFYLLYRAGTSGEFSVITGSQGLVSDGMVWIPVNNTDLIDGYYTLARSNETGRTWYSFKTGDWDDWQTWSLEAGGADIVNPDMLTPTTSPTANIDKVVILSPYVISVSSNNKENAVLNIESGWIDLGSTSGHAFNDISGQGTILLNDDNFPSGDASDFVSETGGTVEYYGTGFNLATTRTFNNLIINLDSPADVITLLSDYSLNGSLTIKQGVFKINNDTETNVLNLEINKNFDIGTSGSVSVGEGNTAGTYSIQGGSLPSTGNFHAIYHQVIIGGSMLNEGTVNFSNLTLPLFNEFTYTGAATVTFSGAANEVANLKGTTNFYNLIIDKGIDRNYILEIHTDNPDQFALYGSNSTGRNENSPFSRANPEIRKALWIKNGTLKLTGYVTIPSLSEGNDHGHGDYPIPSNGKLWIASPGVKVYSTSVDPSEGTGVNTGSAHQAISVFGEFKISSGYFNTRNSAGFIFWADESAVIDISGGIVDVAQFRSSHTMGGKTSFIMSGGELFIRGNESYTEGSYVVNPDGGGEVTGSFPIFGIVDSEGVFQMSGGTIYINDVSGNNNYKSNGVCILAKSENHEVTGGLIHVKTNGNTNVDIVTNGELHDLTLTRMNSSNSVRVYMGSDLLLNRDLYINDYTELVSRRQYGDFNYQSYDLQVGRWFRISNEGNYLPLQNTTTLHCIANSNLYLNKEIVFHNLEFTTSDPTRVRTITGNADTIFVDNDLIIDEGVQLRHFDQIIFVKGNIENSGTIYVDDPATDTGELLIKNRGIVTSIEISNAGSHTSIPVITISGGGGSGATAVPVFTDVPSATNALPLAGILVTNTGEGYTSEPTITISSGGATATASINTQHEISGNGNGVFNRLTIDEPHPPVLSDKITFLSSNQEITNTLTLSDGILDLQNFNLYLAGSLYSENESDYSEQNMLRVTGNYGDGGLTRYIQADGTYLFPFGTYNADANANRYCWAKPTISSFTDDGEIQINPVPTKLPTLTEPVNPTDDRYLEYFWRVRHAEFVDTPLVTNRFNSYVDDFSWNGNHNNHKIGKIVNLVRYADDDPDDLGNLESAVDNKRILNYSVATELETGEFTAGFKPIFNGTIEVYYSRVTSGAWETFRWDDGNNWSYIDHSQPFANRTTAGDYPKAGDIAVIGYGGHSSNGGYNSIIIQNGVAVECAELRFLRSPVDGAWQSRLVVNESASADFGMVTGDGTFKVHLRTSSFPTVTGDFSDFSNDLKSTFNYKLDNNGNFNVPRYNDYYPNLRFEAGSGGSITNRVAYFDEDITINNNLTIDWGARYEARINTEVKGKIQLGDGSSSGRLQFSETTPVTVEAGRLILNVESNNILTVTGSNDIEHNLIVNGSITKKNGTIDLFMNNSGGNNVILELQGTGTNDSLVSSSGSAPSLYKLKMNKGNNTTPKFRILSEISLNGSADGNSDEKPLILQNGTLEMNDPNIDIILSSGGEDFVIPSSAALILQQGTYRITSPGSNGIFLDGYLELSRMDASNYSIMTLDGGAGSDNYIEYSSSGNANLRITGGKLTVGSQIRGSTLNNLGVLKYFQNGNTSEIIVGYNGAPEGSRGVFEILNPGSRFQNYGGKLYIARPHDDPDNATRAELYLQPDRTGLNKWGNIQIGLPGITPAGSVIGVNSNVDLCHFHVDGDATARLEVNDLGLIGELDINAGASFDGNNLDLTLYEDLTNRGTELLNTRTINFLGDAQEIDGNIEVNDMYVAPETSLTLTGATAQVIVNGNLDIHSGQLISNDKTILAKGNVNNDAVHNTSGPGRLTMGGSVLQLLSGEGTFGDLEINNSAGVRTENDIELDTDLYIEAGILNIQDNQLSLGLNSDIIGTGFDNSKMIASDGSFANKGLKKSIPTGAFSFTYPVGIISGTENKYTPVFLDFTSNDYPGSVSIHPVNQAHMTVTGTDVLDYYWTVSSEGISGVSGSLSMLYLNSDVNGDESQYLSAWLYDDAWAKFPVETVYEAEDSIEFTFGGVNNLSGDYTAGIDSHIPATIPLFVSTGTGNWSDQSTWVRFDGGTVPAGGPNGHKVQILPGHTVTLDRFRILSYKTKIEGTLNVGIEYGHNIGYISGKGTISLQNNKFPVGDYTDFISCTGGTVIFGGDASYMIPDKYTTFRKMIISGSGIKSLPDIENNYFTICDTLLITNGSAIENISNLSMKGEFIKENTGIFISGNREVKFDGSNLQYTEGSFSSGNSFKSLTIDNSSGVSLNDDTDISGDLFLTDGKLQTANLVRHTSSTRNIVPEQGNTSSFIDGKMSRYIASTTSTKYIPIGKDDAWKPLGIVSPSSAATSYWTAEYFNYNPGNDGYDPTLFDNPPLYQVSQVEFWEIEGPAGGSARIEIPLRGTSDVASFTSDLRDLRLVKWDGSKWIIVGGDLNMSRTGDASNGSVTTGNAVSFDGSPGIYTLATIDAGVVPTIQFATTSTTECAGSLANLTVTITGHPSVTSYTFTYEDDFGNTYNESVNPAVYSYSFTVNPAVTTTYTLTSIEDNNNTTGTVYGDPAVVTMVPFPVSYNVSGSGTYCENDTVSVDLDNSQTGFNYELFRDGTTTNRITGGTDGSPISFDNIIASGTYTINAYNSAHSSCEMLMSGNANITVTPLPDATISLNIPSSDTICEQEVFQLKVTFTGNAPWNFTYSDGTTNWVKTNISDNPYIFDVDELPVWIDPGLPLPAPREMEYTIVSVSSGGCAGTNGSSVNIWIEKKPDTGPAYHYPNR